MNENCVNYGSSWCADFDCNECPVRDITNKHTAITGLGTQVSHDMPMNEESRKQALETVLKNNEVMGLDLHCETCHRKPAWEGVEPISECWECMDALKAILDSLKAGKFPEEK